MYCNLKSPTLRKIMTLATSTLLDRLNAQLDAAATRLTAARKVLKTAERKEEQAAGEVEALREQVSIEQLRQWGDKPNLAVMLAKDSGYTFYRALGLLAEPFGMGVGGEWCDTRQTVLTLSLNRAEHGAVERVAAGVRYFAPAVKTIKGGWARFNVKHRGDECAWELRYSVKRKDASLVRMVYGSEECALPFATLELALRHVESCLWLEDVIDAAPVALLEGN